jgi:ACS family D-galactonate transporter-like MFS transporter
LTSESIFPGVTSRRRWGIVGLLFAASMINYFDRATISFAMPLISRELSLTPSMQGLLLSAFFWSYALMQIPMGMLADRVNLRWLYAGAFTLWSVAQGLMGFADGLTALIVLRIFLGIGEAIYLPGGSKIVSLLFRPAERGFPSGLFDAGTRSGVVAEGLIVPWMVATIGWRTTFAVVGFASLLWLIPWLLTAPRNLRAPATTAATGAAAAYGAAFTALWKDRNFLGICAAFFCFDYYWYFLVGWLPNYLVTVRGLGLIKAGFMASLPFLVFGLCQPLGGWLADRLIRNGWSEERARKGISTFAFITGLLLIPAAQVEGEYAALGLIMGGCLVGLATANLLVLLQNCAPPGQIGMWTGVYNFIGNIAGIVSPLITGFLIEQSGGSYVPPFLLAAGMIALGPLALWFIAGKVKPAAASG